MRALTTCVVLAQLLLTPLVSGETVNAQNADSLKAAAQKAAASAVQFYNNRASKLIPGKFDDTWWEGGVFFTFLINYWHWTGDDQYRDIIVEGMSHQGGENNDFFPSNYSSYLGNDDQEFWALGAMTAVEQRFPDNSKPGSASWLSLAQGAYNDFAIRWEENKDCRGGLRWQLNPLLAGFGAKNAISNGGFFQLAARLYRYTGNESYAEMAHKVWDWSVESVLFDNKTWYIYDITHIDQNCQDKSKSQWSYNYGAYVTGAAYMYNVTNDAKWKVAVDNLLNSIWKTFFPEEYGSNVLVEACDPSKQCNRDQLCFKGLMGDWLSKIAMLIPEQAANIIPKLQGSAEAAGKQCSGPGSKCGMQWFSSTWDGTTGIEQEMSALSIFANTLVSFATNGGSSPGYTPPSHPGPVTAKTGGNSTSNPTGGQQSGGEYTPPELKPITGGDRAGAAILTLLFSTAWLAAMAWLVVGGFY